jgi:GTP cyclohydrolase I
MTIEDIELEKSLKKILEKIYGREMMMTEGMIETPGRILGYWREFADKTKQVDIKTFDCITSDQMIMIRGINFVSICEHHLLPFLGTVDIVYVPNKSKVIGLSKIPRIVAECARKPQLQERLGTEIKDILQKEINPLGIAIIITARHTCMEARGIRAIGSETKTSLITGIFRSEDSARNELLGLLGV